jgi:NADH-ubiquinone oxidoreductase chain 5
MLLFYGFNDFTYFSSILMPLQLLFFIIITFITKRALYPFSPWLPMAIAAPTPISALVHSSTLVTAGLYLIIRYHYVLYESFYLMRRLFVISIFTSFYAGLNAIFETDFKKLIALSTLSHLGFIGMAFSAGLLHLRFFHLLVHALFKSLLFITIGDIIINLNHSQDSRYLSSGFVYTPFSCFVMSVSLVNLLGLPSLRGFFSKDLVLETLSFSNLSILIEVVLYCNVVFTYYYTYKLFYFSFSPNKLNPYQLFHTVSYLHYTCMLFLGSLTLIFGSIFISSIFPFVLFYPMPYTVKFLPLLLNSLMFLVLFVFLVLPTINTKFSSSYFSSMLFLSNVAMTLSSNVYYSILFNSVKSIEFGFYNFSINRQAVQPTKHLSSALLLTLFKIQIRTFFSCFMFLIVLLVSFLIC